MNRAVETILLVEDDRGHAKLIMQSLRRRGFAGEFVHLLDGVDVIKTLDDRPAAPPSVIILDLRLPRVSGLEVLEQVKGHASYAKIPVVVLTSSAAPTDIAAAYERHANSYIVKPMELRDFMRFATSFLEYWGSWNRLAVT